MDQAKIQEALQGADFPARRDDLVAVAKGNDADPEVIEVLQQLPALTFASPTEVASQLPRAS